MAEGLIPIGLAAVAIYTAWAEVEKLRAQLRRVQAQANEQRKKHEAEVARGQELLARVERRLSVLHRWDRMDREATPEGARTEAIERALGVVGRARMEFEEWGST